MRPGVNVVLLNSVAVPRLWAIVLVVSNAWVFETPRLHNRTLFLFFVLAFLLSPKPPWVVKPPSELLLHEPSKTNLLFPTALFFEGVSYFRLHELNRAHSYCLRLLFGISLRYYVFRVWTPYTESFAPKWVLFLGLHFFLVECFSCLVCACEEGRNRESFCVSVVSRCRSFFLFLDLAIETSVLIVFRWFTIFEIPFR